MKTKLLLIALAAAALVGCGGGGSKPTADELESALTKILQGQCEFASTENTTIENVFFPDSNNTNVANVKFSTSVNVKVISDSMEKYDRAMVVYKDYQAEAKAIEDVLAGKLEGIAKSKKVADTIYQTNVSLKGENEEYYKAHVDHKSELYEQENALRKEAQADLAALLGKYKDRADGVLKLGSSYGIQVYDEPSKPRPPGNCMAGRNDYNMLDLLYDSVRKNNGSMIDYFAGVSTMVGGELEMIKTDKGWMLSNRM